MTNPVRRWTRVARGRHIAAAPLGTTVALRAGMAKSYVPPLRCEIPIFFATTDGHTRHVACRLAEMLRGRGVDSVAIDLATPAAEQIDWSVVRGVVVGASLRMGKHQARANSFVKRHLTQLNERPSAFFSVSLSAVSARDTDVTAARRLARELPAKVGWHPSSVVCIGGALAYTRYGWLTRLVMQRIARAEGGPTDTSRDHDLTRWDEVDLLAHRMMRLVRERAPRQDAA